MGTASRTPTRPPGSGSLVAMTTPSGAAESAAQRSIPELVRGVVSSGQRYALAQRALIETELKRSGQEAATVGALGGIALGAASLFAVFLLLTIAWALVEAGLPTWAGFGIVALLLLLVAIVTALLARAHARKVTPPQLSLAPPGDTPTA